jgi:uncharacterized protein with FMN-binding domain
MPTRAAVAIVATVIGVFLLFSFKTPAQAKPRTPSADVAQASPTPSSSPSAGASASPTAAPTPTPSSNSPYKDGTYTGQDFPNQFGDTQVKVIISGGKIVDVQAIQLPFDRPRSEEISQYAEPQLHDEVLQAQSANIDYLSGATYTSYAYANSVQSALDQAKG